jgi:hypothetical protein
LRAALVTILTLFWFGRAKPPTGQHLLGRRGLASPKPLRDEYILGAVTKGESLTTPFFQSCKAENVDVAQATARLSNEAGWKNGKTKITWGGRAEYI